MSIISGALANGSVLRDDALRAVLEVCHVVARSFMSVEPLSSLVDSTMSILIAYLLNKEALPIAESRRKSKFVRGPVRDLLREVLVKYAMGMSIYMECWYVSCLRILKSP